MGVSPIPEPTDHVGPPDATETVKFFPIRIVSLLDSIGGGESGKSLTHSPLPIQDYSQPNDAISFDVNPPRRLPRRAKGSVRRTCGGGKVTTIDLDLAEILKGDRKTAPIF